MRSINIQARNLVLVIFSLLVGACSNSNVISTTLGPDVSVNLEDAVYFQNTKIGSISNITSSDLGTELQISLYDDAVSLLSSDAVAIENSFKQNSPIEIHNGIGGPGSLEIGSEIQGIDNMVEFGTWSLGNAAGIAGFSLDKYVKQFTDYVNSEEFTNQQAEVNQAIGQSAEMAKQAVNQLGEEVDKGVQQIQDMEEDLVAASEQIGADLGSTAKELEKSGEEIFAEFEKLMEKLTEQSQGSPDGEAAGVSILLALLQGLNGSLEDNESGTNNTNNPENTANGDTDSGKSQTENEPAQP